MDFEQIYQTYFRDVFLYLRSLSANEDIAEEITQETFVKALKAIDTFDGSQLSVTEVDRKICTIYSGNDLGGSAVARVNGNASSIVEKSELIWGE